MLWEEDDIPISTLAARTGLAKTTLTSMLDRMEASGHICRRILPTDRRTVRIALTDAARSLKAQYDTVSAEMNDIFYAGFSDEEIQNLEAGLGKVLENLSKKENRHEQHN